jgi:hypothetical protein
MTRSDPSSGRARLGRWVVIPSLLKMSKEVLSRMLLVALVGCSNSPPPAPSCDTLEPSTLDRVYARYFAAAATMSAAGCAIPACHADSAGNLAFRSASEFYAATVNVRSGQDPRQFLIEPGNPGASYLYRKLAPGAPSERMPFGGPYLNQAAMDEIAGWICAGAPGLGTDATSVRDTDTDDVSHE